MTLHFKSSKTLQLRLGEGLRAMTSLKSTLWAFTRTDQTRYTDGQWHVLGVFLQFPFSMIGWIIQDLAISNYQDLIA
jgi:hypothetical protein